MIDAKLSKPLYEQIRDTLLEDIHTGALKPGERIPSERDLAERFGVSRLTANKAVKELERAGFVYTQTGKGTFIRSAMVQQLEHLTGFSEDMRARGQSAASRVLSAGVIAAPEAVAHKLNLPPGARVIALQRVRMADNAPMALEMTHVIASLCPDILDQHDFSRESLYQVLRRDYGVTLQHAEQTIEARPATREEAGLLGVSSGAAILQMTRVAFTENNRPFEYVQSAYRGDRYKFHVVLRHV